MRRIAIFIAASAINACTIPVLASECTSNKGVDVLRTRWTSVRSQPAKAADKEKTCRAYAASFYESVTLRQAAAKCLDGKPIAAALDSEVNAFNDLLATKCGG